MREDILSVGIDIGTSTTQLIFSRLTLQNRGGSYGVPRVEIVGKEVVYRSAIHSTPLRSATEIDAAAVEKIVREEYRAAGMTPAHVRTGAVIITGETARKENANEVLEALSHLAGDFVVATAGPDLESVLSARGAGTDCLSREKGLTLANLDVGGGTTNIALYEEGHLRGTCCLDVGGRLVKVEGGRVTYLYPKLQALARAGGLSVSVGDPADAARLYEVCRLMARQLAAALHRAAPDKNHGDYYTNGGSPLPPSPPPEGVTYSGGVADCVYGGQTGDPFRYGDVGPLLGRAIREDPDLGALTRYPVRETIRATVVGAGTHTTEVSGSTICYEREGLPMKNLPVLKVEEETLPEAVEASVLRQIPLYRSDGNIQPLAIALTGAGSTHFGEVQSLARAILAGAAELLAQGHPLVVVVEKDIGKVLGNALAALLGGKKGVICIDGIHAASGDYIDIGAPLAGGQVLPVVIKTLIFNS